LRSPLLRRPFAWITPERGRGKSRARALNDVAVAAAAATFGAVHAKASESRLAEVRQLVA